MGYFPINEDEISLIKFIARYQYLNVSDAKYFFNSSRYYRNRIKDLIDKNFLRKIKWSLVLGKSGIQYVQALNFEYNKLNKNEKYKERLLRLSNIGAFYHNCNTVDFTPSFEYLAYQILKEHDKKYIESVAFDMQKEWKHKNFIILVDDINRIDLDYFAFGNNRTLVIEDNKENREKLKYLHSVRWKEVVDKCYNRVYLAEYSFCEYSNKKDKFINTFYFIDTDKIARFKIFMRESPSKSADIICNAELEAILRNEMPNANFCVVDLENYIDKEIRYY